MIISVSRGGHLHLITWHAKSLTPFFSSHLWGGECHLMWGTFYCTMCKSYFSSTSIFASFCLNWAQPPALCAELVLLVVSYRASSGHLHPRHTLPTRSAAQLQAPDQFSFQQRLHAMLVELVSPNQTSLVALVGLQGREGEWHWGQSMKMW